MKKLMVVAVAGAVALGTQAGTFLDSLATNANKVDSSPYATGGDVILHEGGDYIHIFTNTAAATSFTPTQNLSARVLVIGGGGSGGGNTQCTGGGGAGGFVEQTGLSLAAGTAYAVSVGAGGKTATGNGGNNGSNSTFDMITAYGGGGGGGYGSNPKSGGSGGGGYWANGSNATGAQPTDPSQGHAGANGLSNVGGGGGGGAGTSGDVARNSAGTTVYGGLHGGLGGDGKMSDILGFEQYFAGGGGGGSNGSSANKYVRAPGGIGGGGSGALTSADGDYGLCGEPGENGLGAGGGGKGNNTNGANTGGAGGSGIVIVRYFVWTEATPCLRNPSVSLVGGTRVVAEGAVSSHGVGAASTTLNLTLRPAGGGESKVKTQTVSASTEAGDVPFKFYVGNLMPDMEYDYELYAENDQGEKTASVTGSLMTMANSLFVTAEGATITTNEYDVIVNFSVAGTYTLHIGGDGNAQVLVVGGGGAGGYGSGGSCSGGGGGGVLYAEERFLTPGDYQVVVGAGGVNSKGSADEQRDNGHGKNSTFDAGKQDAIVAKGGGSGIGWDVNNATGAGGASGGGGCRNAAAGAGEFGQGFAGGKASGDFHAGGGGGAGGVGQNAATGKPGDGGAGLYYLITGENVCYGSGGGAGCHSTSDLCGQGGENAGNGAGVVDDSQQAATSGVDGTGGGGGGAGKNKGTPGTGGCGCVIIRYTDYTLLPEGNAPVMSVEPVENVQASTIDVPVKMVSMGEADDFTLRIAYWYDAEDATNEVAETMHTKEVATKWGGDRQVFTIAGLAPLRTYYFRMVADGGSAEQTARGEVMTATLLSPFAGGLVVDNATLAMTLAGVPPADDGESSFKVYFGDSIETAEERDTLALTEAGAVEAPITVNANEFGSTKTCFVRYTTTVEGKTLTIDSPAWAGVVTDRSAYTWNPEVAEGYWDDAASWTTATTGSHRGYPVAGSTARIANEDPVTVRVRQPALCASCQIVSTDVTFAGEGEDASFDTTGDMPSVPVGVRFTLKDISFTVRTGGAQMYGFSSDSVVTLDGADLRFCNTGSTETSKAAFSNYDNVTLAMRNGAKVTCALMSYPKTLTMAGSDCRIYALRSGLYEGVMGASRATSEMTFNLGDPKGASDPLIDASFNIRFVDNYVTTLNVPRKAPICSAVKQRVCIIKADYNSAYIDPTKYAFGTVANRTDYFYFTETAAEDAPRYRTAEEAGGKTIKYIWYHHEPSNGMVLIMR